MKATHLTTLAFVFVLFASGHAGAWKFETVDPGPDAGLFTSIALDSSDKVYISYIDWADEDLKYATNASGSWEIWAIIPVGPGGVPFTGVCTCIALDSSDKVHISYIDWTDQQLRYATNTSGSWVTTIPDLGTVPLFSSLALDSLDHAHISYYDVVNDDLRVATNASGSWTAETVDPIGQVGMHTSIAVDSLDKVHICYWGIAGLTHATNETGTWVMTTVDPEEAGGLYSAVALDSSDGVHVSYYDVTNGDLKYATNASGGWVLETLDADGDVGWDTSIALDASDNIHITYYDDTNGDLKHATNASGDWVIEVVDATGRVGKFSSVAVDSRDHVRVSYYNEGLQITSANTLKYAYTTPCIDNDGDGYGDPGDPWCPNGPETDCDDTRRNTNPGATESCDGLDNDCDGDVPPDEIDADEDGSRLCANDCDDNNPEINPRVTEGPFRDPLCSDTIDNDCDGDVDLADSQCCECIDKDRDGYGQAACLDCSHSFPADCDDTEPDVNPGIAEKCHNGIDDDCDGWIDGDDLSDCTENPGWTAAEASVSDAGSQGVSAISNILVFGLLPVGAVILLKRFRRR